MKPGDVMASMTAAIMGLALVITLIGGFVGIEQAIDRQTEVLAARNPGHDD